MNDNQKKLNEQLVRAIFEEDVSLGVRLRKIKYLIYLGADVNIQNKCCMTALMWAAGRYRKDIVQMLLEKGADANIRNNSGRRVWDKSSREIIKVIKEHIKKTSGAPTNGGFLGKIFGGLTR